jgi:hypothetical protein
VHDDPEGAAAGGTMKFAFLTIATIAFVFLIGYLLIKKNAGNGKADDAQRHP